MNPPSTQSSRPERRGTPSLEDSAERTRRTGTPPLALRPVRDSRSPVHKSADASMLVPKQLSNVSLASSTDTGRSSPSTGRGSGRGRGRPPASSKTSTTASRRTNVSSPSSPLSPASDDFASDESARTMTPKMLRQRVKQLKRVAKRDMREMLQFHKSQAAAAATDPELSTVLGDSKKVIHDLKSWLDTLEAYEEQYKGLWSSGRSSTASSTGSEES